MVGYARSSALLSITTVADANPPYEDNMAGFPPPRDRNHLETMCNQGWVRFAR
jgi:hypothetical protein